MNVNFERMKFKQMNSWSNDKKNGAYVTAYVELCIKLNDAESFLLGYGFQLVIRKFSQIASSRGGDFSPLNDVT